jgi:tripartite-type tricarboxylate transporter receptor subunit TctC
MGTLAAAVPINPKLLYNPRTDFVYLGLVSTSPNVVYVRKEFPANNLQEFIAYAKSNTAKLTMGHGGIGAASHVTCVMLFQLIGVDPPLIAYRGFGQTINDLLSGNIEGGCDLLASVSSQAQGGNLKVLAVAADERSAVLPNVPTSAEAGLPAFKTETWTGLFVPKGTPASVVETLNDAIKAALSDPLVEKRLADVGAVVPKPDRRGGAYMQRLVDEEVTRWTEILTKAKVQLKP